MENAKINLDIFFLGATGYIGGSALGHLLNHYRANDNQVHIRALVRSEEKAKKLLDWAKAREVDKLVVPIIGTLDDEDIIVREVAHNDVTIHTAHSDHLGAAKSIVKGLDLAIKRRKESPSKTARPILIHTSGTGLLVDDSYGLKTTDTIYHDDNEDEINSIPDTASHRDVDLVLLNYWKQHKDDVDIAIVAPPTIWGLGTGPDSVQSIQIPLHINKFIPIRQAFNIGKGVNQWTQINVLDLADFYRVLFIALHEQPGKHGGFYFVENGEFSWSEVGTAIQKGLVLAGYTTFHSAKDANDDTTYLTVFGRNEQGFPYRRVNGGNSRARAVRARKELKWEAKYSSHEEFLADITQSVLIQAKFGKDNSRDTGGERPPQIE
ncbi:hypothetical protein AWJ20_1388 [Sugiyamaella lignohabitans]|uniref:NAD(P)-binding domain-containing protein n=1 Tax=Sugiyamaella lignohabitans TaxID=796027 RepID=A0A167DNJ7_9ASCO|nr:uncharacterized protein AWJ20_1388 [Sugiyamaella lignohabitans]ANB13108.1 hypothetical protein AWJ20_1388 [Sugiyamaella lignohabitans]